MTATKPERSVVVVNDDTPAATVRELVEARTRRLMAERLSVPGWGDGRVERAVYVELIDESLDEWLALQ